MGEGKKIKKWSRRRLRGGFSLTELLVATVILVIFTSSISMIISSALKNRADVIMASDAQLLGGTAMQLVRDELRYGVKFDKTTQTFDSFYYGNNVKIRIDDGKLKVGDYVILSKSSYNSGLKLDELTITIDEATRVATVGLKVKKGDRVLWEQEAKVLLLN